MAATSGDLDPLSTGVVYCELVCALQGLAQYDLAEEWTEAMERWAARTPSAASTAAAGCIAPRSCGCEDSATRPSTRHSWPAMSCGPTCAASSGWPLTELGRIRLRLGDVAGAEEAFLAAHQAGWDPQPGLRSVLLARGDVATAAASIRDALDSPSRVPSKELPPSTDLRRAPLLDAQVEIAIAAGDLDRGARRLRRARHHRHPVPEQGAGRLRGAQPSTSAASPRVTPATPNGSSPRRSRLWSEVGAPYEAAVARLGLADAYRARRRTTTRPRSKTAPPAPTLDRIATGPIPAPRRSDRGGEHRTVAGTHQHVPPRGRLLVGGLRGAHRRMSRPQGNAPPRPAPGRPGRELHVLDLVAAEAATRVPAEEPAAAAHLAFGDAGADARRPGQGRPTAAGSPRSTTTSTARATAGDHVREAQADAERDFLVRELSRAVGLGGRDRRAGSASERARAGVTRAIRQAIARISEQHPDLGRAPRARHPHRHLLLLSPRQPCPRRLGPLTSGAPRDSSQSVTSTLVSELE